MRQKLEQDQSGAAADLDDAVWFKRADARDRLIDIGVHLRLGERKPGVAAVPSANVECGIAVFRRLSAKAILQLAPKLDIFGLEPLQDFFGGIVLESRRHTGRELRRRGALGQYDGRLGNFRL